jgi:hypothetical protein
MVSCAIIISPTHTCCRMSRSSSECRVLAMACHLIEVGSLKRQLPVREVKPGVFVALFNPLGGMPHAPGRPPDRNPAPAPAAVRVRWHLCRDSGIGPACLFACTRAREAMRVLACVCVFDYAGVCVCVCVDVCVCLRARAHLCRPRVE